MGTMQMGMAFPSKSIMLSEDMIDSICFYGFACTLFSSLVFSFFPFWSAFASDQLRRLTR
jgi:hypothetical protein